jgi:hypothetical protein
MAQTKRATGTGKRGANSVTLHRRIAWNGEKLFGDRDIYVGQERWGHIEMRPAMGGPRFHFFDAASRAVFERPEDGYPVVIHSLPRHVAEDGRPNIERIAEVARDLVRAGALRSPAPC